MFLLLKTIDTAVVFRWSDWHETECLGNSYVQGIKGHFSHSMLIPAKQLRQLPFSYYMEVT